MIKWTQFFFIGFILCAFLVAYHGFPIIFGYIGLVLVGLGLFGHIVILVLDGDF